MTSGNGHLDLLTFTEPPERVVSLVPSMTDSLYELGAGNRLVGVTDFCLPPEPQSKDLARVGGTRAPDIARIVELHPDLVMANQEENSRPTVERLESAGLAVWTTFPRSVSDAVAILWTLVRLFRVGEDARKVATLEVTLDWTRRASSGASPHAYFCPIWRGDSPGPEPWWMTFNDDTYAGDVLSVCGGKNVFAQRKRRYPLLADLGRAEPEDPKDHDLRYPRVTAEEVLQAQPEIILLPSEPYAFDEGSLAEVRSRFAETPAVRKGRVILVDGSLITWHGTRLARALAELPALLQS